MKLLAIELQVHILSILLALSLWTSPYSSTHMRGLYFEMASIFQIPASTALSWEEIANGQEKQKALLTQVIE